MKNEGECLIRDTQTSDDELSSHTSASAGDGIDFKNIPTTYTRTPENKDEISRTVEGVDQV